MPASSPEGACYGSFTHAVRRVSLLFILLTLSCMCTAGKPAKVAVGKGSAGKGSAAPARSSAASARPASKGKDPAAEKRAQQLAQEAEVSRARRPLKGLGFGLRV